MFNKIAAVVVIFIVVALIGFFISTLEAPEPLEEDPATIAEEWVRESSPTFTQRGGSNLEHVYTVEVEDGLFDVEFTFEADFAGYGSLGEDEMAAQVITEHSILVTVEDGEVVSAVTNGEFDEMTEEMIENGVDETVSFDVYFVIVEDGQESVVPVSREVAFTQGIGRVAIENLLEGPTTEELDQGYSTAINEGTELLSLHIEDGVAYADFSEELEVAGGSALVTAIQSQIRETLLQFETVDEVEISIEGETEDILQP